MVMYVVYNSNLSKEIFAIDTQRAVICSLGHGRKYMLTILPTIWRPGLIGLATEIISLISDFIMVTYKFNTVTLNKSTN